MFHDWRKFLFEVCIHYSVQKMYLKSWFKIIYWKRLAYVSYYLCTNKQSMWPKNCEALSLFRVLDGLVAGLIVVFKHSQQQRCLSIYLWWCHIFNPYPIVSINLKTCSPLFKHNMLAFFVRFPILCEHFKSIFVSVCVCILCVKLAQKQTFHPNGNVWWMSR